MSDSVSPVTAPVGVQALHTRFLYPFYVGPELIQRAGELQAARAGERRQSIERARAKLSGSSGSAEAEQTIADMVASDSAASDTAAESRRAAARIRESATRSAEHPAETPPDWLAQVEGLLLAARASTGKQEKLWHANGSGDASHIYKDELVGHAASFLFGDPAAGSCRRLQLDRIVVEQWFARACGELRQDWQASVAVISGPLVELFLSPHGVGVLSIALASTADSLTAAQALDFNYRLAQFRRHDYGTLRKPHPADDPERWQKIPEAQRASMAPPPRDGEPIEQRLGAPGGRFHLVELAEYVLRPISGLMVPAIQEELAVYTVARAEGRHDFADEDVRRRFSTLLASLAQVEESGHIGSVPGVVPVANALLNRGHWAAVGLLGAAHLVLDQSDDAHRVAFDESKVPIVRDKYFMQYLLALLQRLTLNRAIHLAGEIGTRGPESGAGLSELHRQLLQFAVRGDFAQTSVRQVLHQYYQLARTGLDVPSAWTEIRRAVSDLDARHTATAQVEFTASMDKNLDEVRRVQSFLHNVERFIISVYFAHLWHMFAEGSPAVEHLAELVPGHTSETAHWIVSLGVLFFAALGYGVSIVIDRLGPKH